MNTSTRECADRQRWHRRPHLHPRLPTLGPDTLTLTPILTITIPIITYPTIQLRSSATMKGPPLLPGLSWSVSCSPSSPLSLCSADPLSPLFLLARQLLSSVSSDLPLSPALSSVSTTEEKERSALPRTRSASLKNIVMHSYWTFTASPRHRRCQPPWVTPRTTRVCTARCQTRTARCRKVYTTRPGTCSRPTTSHPATAGRPFGASNHPKKKGGEV